MSPSQPQTKTQALRAIFFGGLIPVIIFTVIEEYRGPVAGTIAAMIFGLGEILYEKVKLKSVSAITWIGNGLVLGLGLLSVFSQEGIWFKLQPALMEGFFALFLWGSVIMKKNFMVLMMEKQGQSIPDQVKLRLSGMTVRLGFFFAFHAALATWAAFYWSTTQWALLKGVGVTVSMALYIVGEVIWIRIQVKKSARNPIQTVSKS